ncbi:type II toxin-antitoxin system RelE/ParE family toxin [Parapedobacter sp.]|uniref:type II toxin-antitoxin system RelE/ParE family toxin n=1 Tax=Parapedobacter sp. TaxID=1958893 RepID=UPI0039C94FFF
MHYTPKAKKSLQFLHAFITEKFGKRRADKFIREAEKTILLLKEQPYLFKKSELGENIGLALLFYISFGIIGKSLFTINLYSSLFG